MKRYERLEQIVFFCLAGILTPMFSDPGPDPTNSGAITTCPKYLAPTDVGQGARETDTTAHDRRDRLVR